MIYLDHIAALHFWRSLDAPAVVRERCPTAYVLRNCPENARQLRRELADLPDWMPRHLMVPEARLRHLKDECRYTCHDGPLPAGSFYRVGPSLCVASPELVFAQSARSLSLPQLVLLGDELCGTYRCARGVAGGFPAREKPLCSRQDIDGFLARFAAAGGCKNARRSMNHVVEGSASPMESVLACRLSLPRRCGGFGLPWPLMNHRVEFDETARLIAGCSFAVADLCWPAERLDVEYDSDQWHSTPERAKHDKARANAMHHMGYTVMFATKEHLSSPVELEAFASAVAKHLGVRLRRPTAAELQKREWLDEQFRLTRTNLWFQPAPASE